MKRVSGILLIIPLLAFAIAAGGSREPIPAGRQVPAISDEQPHPPISSPSGTDTGYIESVPVDEELIQKLKTRYGHLQENIHAQLELTDDLARYLGGEAEGKMAPILRTAFPQTWEQMLNRRILMTNYRNWFNQNSGDFADMSHSEITALLREKQNEFFGEDAQRIWAEAERNRRFYETLDHLEAEGGEDLRENFSTLLSAAGSAPETRTASARPAGSALEMLNLFLHTPSVQKSMGNMAPEEKKELLRSLRQTADLSPEAVEALARIDEHRRAKENCRGCSQNG